MNFDEIDFILSKNSCTDKYFLGCVDIYNFVKLIRNKFDWDKSKNIVIVLLLENPTSTVGHYIVLFWQKTVTNIFHCTLFDSLGGHFDSKTRKKLKSVLNFTNTTTLESNSVQYQSSNSCVCALYSIVAAISFCQGNTLKQFTNNFDSQDRAENDQLVFNFVKKHFKYISRDRLITCAGFQE